MYLETINEKAFRSFLSNPDISILDGNVLDKHHNSDFYRFVRVPRKRSTKYHLVSPAKRLFAESPWYCRRRADCSVGYAL